MGLAQASGSEEWAVSSTVSMQAEVTAALINAASKVALCTFSQSTWSPDCVCANLVSSFHLNLGLPPTPFREPSDSCQPNLKQY